MDGIRDIGGTDKLHAGIIGGVQMCKAVLGYDGTLKADTFRFPQTLLQIRYTAHLAAKADFTDGNELIAHGAVQKRCFLSSYFFPNRLKPQNVRGHMHPANSTTSR